MGVCPGFLQLVGHCWLVRCLKFVRVAALHAHRRGRRNFHDLVSCARINIWAAHFVVEQLRRVGHGPTRALPIFPSRPGRARSQLVLGCHVFFCGWAGECNGCSCHVLSYLVFYSCRVKSTCLLAVWLASFPRSLTAAAVVVHAWRRNRLPQLM